MTFESDFHINDDFDFGDRPQTQPTCPSGDQIDETIPPIFTPFEPTNIKHIDFGRLKPRPWVYGRRLVRGFVSALCGDGGTGKTSLAIGVGLSIAIDEPLMARFENDPLNVIHKNGPVMYYNLEDPQEEMELRLAAEICERGMEPTRLYDRLYVASGRDHPMCVVSIGKNGQIVRHDVQPAIDLIKKLGLILLVVDPYMNAHAVDGNRNEYVTAIIDQFRKMAHEANCAIWIVHHFRKGGQAGDVQSSLGAIMFTNSCRVVETVTLMTETDANALGIDPNKRFAYVRIDDAKRNLSPRLSECEWYQFHSVRLDNGDDEYPDGDEVGVLVPWHAGSLLHDLSWHKVSALLDEIDKGIDGEYYTAETKAKRWVGRLVMQTLAIDEARAKALVRDWLKEGVLKKGKYESPSRDRHECQRLMVLQAGREKLLAKMGGVT